MIYVLYHANCPDGFGAAWAAWKRLKGEGVIYIPVRYGEPLPEIPNAQEVYILDFSYPRDVLEELAQRVKLLVIDHHKTAKDALEGFPHAIFDMSKSGAVLAWEYFHPDKQVPKLLEYIQDRDLWKWELPKSREVNAALRAYSIDFDVMDELSVKVILGDLAKEGEGILRFVQSEVVRIADRAVLSDKAFPGYKVPIVNTTAFQSEVGEELLKRYPDSPFAATYMVHLYGKVVWSLRSRGDFDVSEIAKARGGGGHKAAAGFIADIADSLEVLRDARVNA